MDAREPVTDRRLGERDCLEAARRVLADHVGRDVGVEQPRDLRRDDAVGIGAGPRVDVPVVPRADRRHREVDVVGDVVQPLAGEAGEERREVHRRVDAVDVHVGDAGVDVPRAAAHLVEADRLERVLVDRATDDRVEPDVRQLLAVVHPDLAAVVLLDDARRAVGELGRHPTFEGVGRLDDVVVGRDHDVLAGRPLGLGQEGDRALGARLGLGEAQVVAEILEGAHHQIVLLSHTVESLGQIA